MKGLIFHMINNENDDKIINLANKSKFFEWTDDNVAEAFEIFNANSHQLFYNHMDYKTNKTYFNINKCARIKKSWKCHYYGCLPCMFEYLNYNYEILKELRCKLIGKPCYMITYRIPLFEDDISKNYNILVSAVNDFKLSRLLDFIPTAYEKFLEEIGYLTSIISFECPFSYADNIHILHNHEFIIAQNVISKNRSLEIEKDFNFAYGMSLNKYYNPFDSTKINEFTNAKFIYTDNQQHYKAIMLLNDFNSPEYLANPYKLLRGFETMIDKSIQIDKQQTYSPYLNSVYSFNREYYLNFVDNLPVNRTVDYKRNPLYQSSWIKYGDINGIDLREYFRVGKFRGMSLAQIRQMKEDNQIAEIVKYRRKKYKNEKGIDFSTNLLNYINFREDLNIIDLNEKLTQMKRKDDVTYLVMMTDRLSNFKIGFYAGYINGLMELEQQGIEMRQLVNHEGDELPVPQTDNEIVEDIQMSYDKFLSNPTC